MLAKAPGHFSDFLPQYSEEIKKQEITPFCRRESGLLFTEKKGDSNTTKSIAYCISKR
jgi:hypothetical protein